MSEINRKLGQTIRERRIDKSMTQAEMAELLGMSRPTYIDIEKGSRELKVSELSKVASTIGIQESELLGGKKHNYEKFAQMMLYILSKYENGIPKTKLAKLLYLADFSCFYLNLEPMSNVSYIRRDYGPVADVFFETLDNLFETGKIDIEPAGRAMLVKRATYEKSDSLITDSDKKLLDKIDAYWHNRNTSEIVNFTHNQRPWAAYLDGEVIDYPIINAEDPDNVYAPINIYN